MISMICKNCRQAVLFDVPAKSEIFDMKMLIHPCTCIKVTDLEAPQLIEQIRVEQGINEMLRNDIQAVKVKNKHLNDIHRSLKNRLLELTSSL